MNLIRVQKRSTARKCQTSRLRSELLVIRFTAFVVATSIVACTGKDGTSAGAAGLATVFDSTADTITARVDGSVPISAMRTMDIVMRVAPAMDDTTLFSEVNDFEVG